MPKFYFFSEPDALQSQTSGQAFGPIESGDSLFVSGKDRFRISDMHTAAAAPKAYAVCNGSVCAQAAEDDSGTAISGIVNLILKPSQQPDTESPYIAYFVYHGIKADSFWDGSEKILQSGTLNDLVNTINSSRNANNNDIPDSKTLGIHLTPFFTLDGNQLFKDEDPVDHLFYKGDPDYPFHRVNGGDWIGDFDPALFGFSIILERTNSRTPIQYVRKRDSFIEVDTYTGNTSPAHNVAHFDHWFQKERLLDFMDPCMFWGSFRKKTLKKKNPSGGFSNLEYQEIYDDLLQGQNGGFFNRNRLQLDIRNEHFHSLNYYQYYGNLIEIRFEGSTATFTQNYYASGWPWLLLEAPFGLPTTQTSISLEINLPKADNSAPIAYWDQSPAVEALSDTARFIKLQRNPETDFLFAMQFHIPLIEEGGEMVIRADMARILYGKRLDKKTYTNQPQPPDTSIPYEFSFDNLFNPQFTTIPWELDNKFNVRLYHEPVFVDHSEEGGEKFYIGQVGVGEDSAYKVFFLLPLLFSNGERDFGHKTIRTFTKARGLGTLEEFLNYLSERARYPIVERQPTLNGMPVTAIAAPLSKRTDLSPLVLVLKKASIDAAVSALPATAMPKYHSSLFLPHMQTLSEDGVSFEVFAPHLATFQDDGGLLKLHTATLNDPSIAIFEGPKSPGYISPELEAACDCQIDQAFLQGHLQRFVQLDPEGLPGSGLTNLVDFFTADPSFRYNGGTLANPSFPMQRKPTDDPKTIANAALQFTLWYFRKGLLGGQIPHTAPVGIDQSQLYKCLEAYIQGLRIYDVDGSYFDSILGYFDHRKANPDPMERIHPDKSTRTATYILDRFLRDLLSPDQRRSTIMSLIYRRSGSAGYSAYLGFIRPDYAMAILRGIEKLIADSIIKCTNQLYTLFGGVGPPPQCDLISAGEGSFTRGILGEANDGIRLFNYEYFNFENDYSGTTKNVISTRTRNRSLTKDGCLRLYDQQSSCYLGMFGNQGGSHSWVLVEVGIEGVSEKLHFGNYVQDRIKPILEITSPNNSFTDIPREFPALFEAKIDEILGDNAIFQEGISRSSYAFNYSDNNVYTWSAPDGSTIGWFDPNTSILSFHENYNGKCLVICLLGIVQRTGSSPNYAYVSDETTLTVIVSPHRFETPSLVSLFAEYRFQDNLYLPDPATVFATQPEINAAVSMLQALQNGAVIETDLLGRGIGTVKDLLVAQVSSVERDLNQNDRTNTEAGVSVQNFDDRRYTFIQIHLFPATTVHPPSLSIVIEGYASPLRCTWGTNWPGPPASLGTLINPRVRDLDNSHSPPQVYNAALSALRTMGALEAVLTRFLEIALNEGILTTPLQETFNAALNNSYVIVRDKNGDPVGQSFTFQDYLQCK